MNLEQGQELHGFTVLTAEPLPEIDGDAYTLSHPVSGAKLLFLRNDDRNKAFSIAFRTPPADDTGVFHILEHSVLCGSEKFPVKEPFVNLLKTSMQTFLNAMTFGDKTLYPVASTNDQDLMNLADVYMDAVLHPDIYRKRQVFEQEGWHLEVADAEQGQAETGRQLTYNGVVYNEMKGALSDSTSVLYDQLQASLFPDTPYAFESGGTPEAIPTLTYEHYLEEHERHYRLDNSYIVLYGNLDLDRMLAFLDERYLTPVAAEQAKRRDQRAAEGLAELAPRTLPVQGPVRALGVRREMATAPENACMGLGWVIGHVRERTRIVATDILLDAIAGSNEAPLKRALLDSGIAGDVQSYLADSVQQPFAVLQVRDLGEDAAKRLRPAVDAELERLAAGGLDHALVEASISRAEFVMRERDFGMADGVALAMTRCAAGSTTTILPQPICATRTTSPTCAARVTRAISKTLSARCSWTAPIWPRWRWSPSRKQDDPGQRRLAELARRLHRRRLPAYRGRGRAASPHAGGAGCARGCGEAAAADGRRHRACARRARLRPGRGRARSLHPPSPAHARPGLRLPLLRYELP